MNQAEVIEAIQPQPRRLDHLHPEYAALTVEQRSDRAHEKLRQYIDQGQRNASAALQRIMAEQIDDRLVRAQAVDFVAGPNGLAWDLPGSDERLAVHPHALDQFAQRVGFPTKFLHEIQGSAWGRQLAADNLNALYANVPEDDDKVLVRSVGDQVRGVLSNSYKPEDSRPAIDAILGVAREAGAVVANATALDTRVSLKVMLAQPVELYPGEFAVLGLDYRSSDYGHGAREICGWVLRLLCLNGATIVSKFRRVHLGAKLHDEVDYSARTRQLNSDASASAARDVSRALLGEGAVRDMVANVRAAASTGLDPDAALAQLKKDVSKAEGKSIIEKFNSPDVELLPAGQNAWRWSNAISWLATQTEDQDRRLDLELLAGNALKVS